MVRQKQNTTTKGNTVCLYTTFLNEKKILPPCLHMFIKGPLALIMSLRKTIYIFLNSIDYFV